mmetsp:Transcript_52508/g.114617  ORF Transcript_52508/g.114617 Transcript_52508/m.114617 type:complete len:201 (+) Transcript_52508:344-946(+)
MHQLPLEAKQGLRQTHTQVCHQVVAQALEARILSHLDGDQSITWDVLWELAAHAWKMCAVTKHGPSLDLQLQLLSVPGASFITWDLEFLDAIMPLIHPHLPLMSFPRTRLTLATPRQVRPQSTGPTDHTAIDGNVLLTSLVSLLKRNFVVHLKVVHTVDFSVTIFLVLLDQLHPSCVVQQHLNGITEDLIGIPNPAKEFR